MPFTKEERKEYDKEYYEKNKQKIKEQRKEYYQQNKEQRKEYDKKYHDANKEKIKEYQKKYYKISKWKSIGVISDDYDALYNIFINTNECQLCSTVLTNKKYLDHCHITGEFKNILCGVCNVINSFNLQKI
jgi:hypothetical protein